jgi:3-oxoacyl-[acyl-carrier-protein] synthase-3
MKLSTDKVGIRQLTVCVPTKREAVEDKRFSKIVGVKEKRISEGLTALDYGVEACKTLDLLNVGFIIFCSQTHEHLIPFNSNLVQDRLNLPKDVGTMDINTGCTGFVLGLMTAFTTCEKIKNDVLLITVISFCNIFRKRTTIN